MPSLKQCHYETLGVERNATDEDIKKAFRKLALQQHPDKNPHRMDEAKEEFQMLQQAYEVLSNPQERAWYDSHRIALIRGDSDGEFEDDVIDIMPFCSSSCYKGFGDDDEGFYTVYRKLFEKITAEELDAGGGEDDSEDEIPNFGDSQSGYEDVVGPFYIYWEAYCTRQSFGWVDEYNTRHAGNRRVARLMDKENKKFRSKAKQMWNQKVRALVDFVKRKDKRFQAWKVEQERILKEKEEAARKKQAEEKASRLRERKKLFENLKSAKENHLTENQDQLKQLESFLAHEFDDADGVLDDEEEEEEYLDEYCVPCQKSFRTKQALINHEKSKKHLQQLERWAEETNISSDSDSNNSEDNQEEEEEEAVVEEENVVEEKQEDEIIIDQPDEKSNGISNIENGGASKKESEAEQDEDEEEDINNLSSRFVKNMKFKVESFDIDNSFSKSDDRTSGKSSKRKGAKSKKQSVLVRDDDEDDNKEEVNIIKVKTAPLKSKSKANDDTSDEEFTTGKKSKEKKKRRANKTTTTNIQSAPSTNNNSKPSEITNGSATTKTINPDSNPTSNEIENGTILITGSGDKVKEDEKSAKKTTTK